MLEFIQLPLDFLLQGGEILLGFLGVIGVVFTLFDIYRVRTSLIEWWKNKKKFNDSATLLNAADYFIAHVIHLGGEFSQVYSLTAGVYEDGGYYLNPSREFVSVSFNRSGDLMVVGPSDFAAKHGFIVESFSDTKGNTYSSKFPEICHLPISDMKNEYFVRFVRKS